MGGWHPDHTKAITWNASTVNTVGVLDSHPMLGTVVELLEGLLDHPEFRVNNRVRPGRHGSRRGRLKLGAKGFTMSGIIFGAGRVDLETRKADLQALLVPSDEPEVFGYEHPTQGLQQVTARIEQPLVWGDPFELGATGPLVGCRWQVGFTAHDPRRYAQALQSATSSAVATGGGFSAPMTAPLAVTGSGTGSTATIAAGGNFERPATIRIYGPVTNPIVEDVSAGSGLNIAFDGLTIASGDYVEVDTDEQSARMYFGSASGYLNVYGYLDFDATTFVNLPSSAITLRLRGAVITDPAQIVVSTRDAYI